MFQVGEVSRSDAHGGGGDAVPHWCSSTSVTFEMLMSSLSMSETRGKFEVLFNFNCHAELAAMDGASGSLKNKYVWHRCGGCVEIFTCVWLKIRPLEDATLDLTRMGLCGVSEVSRWSKRVDRECVGRGRMHVCCTPRCERVLVSCLQWCARRAATFHCSACG